MARQDKSGLHGIVGPVVYKVVDKVQIVSIRVAPGKMKQTTATKNSSALLGLASQLAKNIRECLEYDLAGFQDGKMNCRLNGTLRRSLSESREQLTGLFNFDAYSFSNLADLEFNKKSNLKNNLRIKPDVIIKNGELRILFPDVAESVNLKFPKGSITCDLTVAICLINLKEGYILKRAQRQTITVNADNRNLSGKEFLFNVPEGCFCIAGLFLKFSNGQSLINNKKFSPAAIVGAFITPGTFVAQEKQLWNKMHDLKFG